MVITNTGTYQIAKFSAALPLKVSVEEADGCTYDNPLANVYIGQGKGQIIVLCGLNADRLVELQVALRDGCQSLVEKLAAK